MNFACTIETVGQGPNEYHVVPGIVDAPGDWDELARESNATLRIIRKPLPEKGKQNPEAWRKYWRESLQEFLTEAQSIIAHSAGCLDVLHVSSALRAELLVLLAPPTQESFSVRSQSNAEENPWDDPQKRMMHELLAPLCIGMEKETYVQLLDRHMKAYGDALAATLKRERPNDSTVSIDEGRSLLKASNCLTLLVDGTNDPWSLPVRREQMTKDLQHIQVEEISTGHFPHIQDPTALFTLLRKHR